LNRITPPNSVPPGSSWEAYLGEPPFVVPPRPEGHRPGQPPDNIWTMSQRAGAISYVTFGGGLSLLVYALFVLACDRGSLQIGLFRTFGTNALLGYILHDLVNSALKPFIPNDSPLWYVFTGFAVSLAICYIFLRHLEKHRLFLRL
jgi:hypothetical protein